MLAEGYGGVNGKQVPFCGEQVTAQGQPFAEGKEVACRTGIAAQLFDFKPHAATLGVSISRAKKHSAHKYWYIRTI
jgi:hypothetical protein